MHNNKQKKIRCPYCRGRVVRRGFRATNLGAKQRYRCTRCFRTMTPAPNRFRYHMSDIAFAVRRYRSGHSLAIVQRDLGRRDVRVSRWTIAQWNRKF